MSETAQELVAVLRGGPAGSALRVEQVFATTASDLWEAMTSPTRIGRWMATTTLDGDPAVGTRFRIDVGAGAETTGAVTRCEPPRLLEVTWELAGEPDRRLPANQCTVTLPAGRRTWPPWRRRSWGSSRRPATTRSPGCCPPTALPTPAPPPTERGDLDGRT